jgi:hypothetical protein
MFNTLTECNWNKSSYSSLKKILLFLFFFYILDFVTGELLKYYYFTQDSGPLYQTTFAIEGTRADLLIFGTSKANHSYNPEIFTERLKISAFNAGRDGGSIFYDFAILESILKRYSPKIIILDVSWEFEKKQDSYDRLSMLLPYYQKHSDMRPIIEQKSNFEKIKMYSRVYPYNSMLFSIFAGNLKYNRLRVNDLNGFVPLSKVWQDEIRIVNYPDYKIDSIKIKYYKAFIEKCIELQLKLYIVVSPDFMKLVKLEKSNIISKEIAANYNVAFYDYSRDTLFLNNSKYFADQTHLNHVGADVFTNKLLDEIQKDLYGNNTN